MTLLDILKIYDSEVNGKKIKVHLATSCGKNPLDVFYAGNFNDWQSWQSRKNFCRNYVIALISLPEKDKWLFAGFFCVQGSPVFNPENKAYRYNLSEDNRFQELVGRLIVSYHRAARQSYLCGENTLSGILVSELKNQKMSIGDFPGYKNVDISKSILDTIVKCDLISWKTALSNVAGVYLITDRMTGKLYVGSATGNDGIWQRWLSYSQIGHGNNLELKRILTENPDRAENFYFSILEIADTHASNDDILKRESHWKNILDSRRNGLNGN